MALRQQAAAVGLAGHVGLVVSEHVARRPAEALRSFIAGYSGYRQAGLAPAVHRGMPSPYLTLIFTLHEPMLITEHPDPGQPGGSYETLVGGLHTSPALISHDGYQSGIQVALSPLGARALLGVPAGELAFADLEGTDVLGGLAGDIRQRLQACATWPQRFAVLDDLLLARACGGQTEARPEVGYAWRTLLRSGGRVSVDQLAAETGWSDRHLRTQFRAEIGLAPKAAARVIRFDRARRLLMDQVRAGRQPCLAELAVSSGYYDQAHLDREFGALAGCPPTVWLAQEFRNIQAAADEQCDADRHE
jgi:AraC-like DNA-binding protein